MGDVSDPTEGQTEVTIGDYLSRCDVGSKIAIRETHAGILRFVLTTIIEIDPRFGCVYTAHMSHTGDSWWRWTGRSTYYPAGPSHLVEPTEAVRAFVRRYPRGVAFDGEIVPLYRSGF